MKQLLKITAKTLQDKVVDLEFVSIKQARFFNPSLKEFEIKGLVHKEQRILTRYEK